MPMPTRVILVRHGRSTFNEQGRYQGSSNEAVLTQKGKETAQLVGQYLQHSSVGTTIDVIYTSPLRRVQQTAYEITKAMAPAMRSPIVISDQLKEISLSCWEGLTYEQVKQQFASQYHRWQQCPHKFELPVNGESVTDEVPEEATKTNMAITTETYFPVQDLYQAARQFWATMLPRHAGSTILIVSHSGTIHALLSTALGISPAYHHSLQQSNCGISELTFSGLFFQQNSQPGSQQSLQQNVRLQQLNQTTALGEVLPKLKVTKKGLRLLLASAELTARSGERLAHRLKAMPIDFCLSADTGQKWLHLLTQEHPKILCLESQKDDFLQDWQRHLAQSRRAAEGLMTALAIAPTASIQKLLMQTLGGSLEEHNSLQKAPYHCLNLRAGYLSVIHYPDSHRPVVQAINI